MNKLYCGDNLEVMHTFKDDFVDLIYLDPPFFSNRKYNVIWGDEAEIRSFEDRWEGGIESYISWMSDRIFEMRRVLKGTGSIYLHCDWHATHRLRVLMDDIFGSDCFRNEIIWHYRKWSNISYQYQRNHDTILYYTKNSGKIHTFNIDRMERANSTKKRFGEREIVSGFNEEGKRVPSKIKETDSPGPARDDVWLIGRVPPIKQKYPTEKPLHLLKRIIKVSSNPDDVVLDPFCGCGTTLIAAHILNRQWIEIDISYTACEVVKQSLSSEASAKTDSFQSIGMPTTVEDSKRLKHFDFQNWILRKGHAYSAPKKSGDKGIDGFSFLHKYPIQVKQSEHVGRNVVDNFKAALDRIGEKIGFIVAFSFTSGSIGEVARLNRDEGYDIKLVTVHDILNGHTLTNE